MKKFFLAWAVLMAAASPAWAHEKRKVGEYEFVVGFLNEPAFSGQMNGIDLRVTRGGKPVEGLEGTLRAAVFHGEASRPVELKRRYKQPGAYAGYFLPTKPGDYAFRFEGKAEKAEINETFKTSDGKFGAVEDSKTVEFP